MKKIVTLRSFVIAALFAIGTTAVKAQGYTENFDNIATLTGSGWFIQNNSSPLGANTWFQGTPTTATPDPGPFNAFNGAVNAYIAVNFASTSGGTGTISNWLVTPNRTLRNGDVFQFYTRKPTIGTGQTDFPDRLEVRMSTNGASTNVGSTAPTFGDFSTLLLSINPTLITNVYPQVWTQYTVTVSGLPAPTSGRIAFRYFVTNGGPTGANSDYIGIDNVVYTPYVCPVFTMTGSGALTGGTAGSAYSQALTQTGALGAPNYAVTAGALPPGLTLSAVGTISGTPTATGTFNFTATVNDASGCSGSSAYSITVVCPTGGASFASSPALCDNNLPVTLTQGTPAGGTYSGTGVSGGMFDPAAGTQTLTYTVIDAYGCTQVASNTITVNTSPVVTAASDAVANTLCAGSMVTLTGGGADTYTWDNGVMNATPFTAATSTTYIVTGMETATGCGSTATISLTVNPLPTVAASSDALANTLCAGDSVILTGSGADTYAWDNGVTDGVAFMPTDTITYTVTGTETVNGCSASAMITVTVNPLPLVTASSDAVANTVCEGALVTLTGAGADTYVWDNGVTDAVPFPAADTTMYMVTGSITATGCSAMTMITINVNPLPLVDLASYPTPFCDASGMISLVDGTPSGGVFSGTGVTGNTFDTGTGIGTYAIIYTYTDLNGCSNSDTSNLEVQSCLGITSAEANNTIVIYPNPNTGVFTLTFAGTTAENIVIRVTDVQGRIVLNETAAVSGAYTQVFDLSTFGKGVYLLEVTGGQNNTHQKIVIQ